MKALVDLVFSKFIDQRLCKQDILDLMELHGLIAKFSMNASNKMAIEVRNFIERTLDGFSHDLSWLSNLGYELSVVCTYCLECTRDLHGMMSCCQDDCLHLLRVGPGEDLICLKNFSDVTVKVPGWEMWFEVPHSQVSTISF